MSAANAVLVSDVNSATSMAAAETTPSSSLQTSPLQVDTKVVLQQPSLVAQVLTSSVLIILTL